MIAIFSIVPVDKGEALSKEVAPVIDLIDKSGLDYQLTSMGTIVEGEAGAVWALMRACHQKMRESSRRVSTRITIDDREDEVGAMKSKVDDIEQHLNRKLKT